MSACGNVGSGSRVDVDKDSNGNSDLRGRGCTDERSYGDNKGFSFIQTGRERRHASCVGDEAGFEPRTSVTEAGVADH